MKTVFLRQKHSPELLVFFNGWSRDEQDAAHLSGDSDVLEVHDYTALEPEHLAELIKPYGTLKLVAWSLGVRAAAEVFAVLDRQPDEALAINGTLYPAHPEFGIAPEIYDGTAENWTDPDARRHFLRRMAGSASAAQELPVPERSPEDQQAELRAIRKRAAEGPLPRNPFRRAVAGTKDRIIPFAAQKAFWETEASGTSFSELLLPHYPFAGLSDWEEVLRLGRA